MEFMMTYGWAILVLVVVLGALFYIGVFNPQGNAPSACTLPSGLSCYVYKVDSNAQLTLDIGQATGKKLRITGVACSKAASPALTAVDVEIKSGSHKLVTDGVTVTCKEADDSTPSTSLYYKGKLVISYTEVDTGLLHTITGDITARLEG